MVIVSQSPWKQLCWPPRILEHGISRRLRSMSLIVSHLFLGLPSLDVWGGKGKVEACCGGWVVLGGKACAWWRPKQRSVHCQETHLPLTPQRTHSAKLWPKVLLGALPGGAPSAGCTDRRGYRALLASFAPKDNFIQHHSRTLRRPSLVSLDMDLLLGLHSSKDGAHLVIQPDHQRFVHEIRTNPPFRSASEWCHVYRWSKSCHSNWLRMELYFQDASIKHITNSRRGDSG